MQLIIKEGGVNMKKNAFFLVFIMILFPFISEDKKPLFQFEFIKYPKEIVVPKDWKKAEFNAKAVVYYRYNGRDIISCEGKFSVSRYTSFSGNIHYIDKKGKIFQIDSRENILPKILWSKSGNSDAVAYASGAVYSQEIEILFPLKQKDTKLEEAINKKELSMIKMTINECTIELKLEEGWKIWKELMKREFKFKINKTLEMSVRYDN